MSKSISPLTQDWILTITRIFTVLRFTQYLKNTWLLFRDQLSWIFIAFKKWVVLVENYPLMSLPGYLNTKDREPVNQFGHLYYKTEVLGTQAETRLVGGGREREREVNQTTSTSEWKTRRDLMEADVHQQLTGVSSEGLGLIKLFLMNITTSIIIQ